MAPAEPRLRVEVVWGTGPHDVRRVALSLAPGATAHDALSASGLLAEAPGLSEAPLGVWGRACTGQTPLRDLDRVEVYRDLQVDPKEARRLRYGKGERKGRGRGGKPVEETRAAMAVAAAAKVGGGSTT